LCSDGFDTALVVYKYGCVGYGRPTRAVNQTAAVES